MKNKMNHKKSHRFYAGALSFMLGMTGVFTPDFKALAAAGENAPEIAETTEETARGEYVICADGSADLKEAQSDAAWEIAESGDAVLYEADLTQTEALQMEQEENLLVEENFFLTASGKKKEKRDKERQRLLERKALLKKAFQEEKACTEWNFQMIHADEETELPESSDAVKVAVLDSGVELISGIPVRGSVNLVKEEQYMPYYMEDMTGHGTASADIIHQICPSAELYSVRVLDRENRGRLSDVTEGIYWCIENDMDIINMSFGTPKESEILKKAVSDAAERGILIVGAAGNGGAAGVEYPAAYPEAMAVGAVNTSAERTEESAIGAEMELTAPGEQILTKSMFGMETVNSGTSMAAPHVTGTAAMLMTADREKSAEEIRFVLDASGNPLGSQNEYGYGLIDVQYAKELLEEDAETVQEMCLEKEEAPNEERKPVETFEDVDYVEGRWHKEDHPKLMETSINEYMALDGRLITAKQIRLLKAGSVFPDKYLKHRANYPEWHGYYTKNYVANYIFATKIAKNGGDTTDLARTKGQDVTCYDRMKNTVSKSGITDQDNVKKSWANVFSTEVNLNGYADKSASEKQEWKKYFLYGMASHTISDTFAHSSFYRNPSTGRIEEIVHPSTDDLDGGGCDKNKNRYKCAALAVFCVILNCQDNSVGDIIDFSAYGSNYWKGFYLGNILKYALQSDKEYGSQILTDEFKAVNHNL